MSWNASAYRHTREEAVCSMGLTTDSLGRESYATIDKRLACVWEIREQIMARRVGHPSLLTLIFGMAFHSATKTLVPHVIQFRLLPRIHIVIPEYEPQNITLKQSRVIFKQVSKFSLVPPLLNFD